MHQDSDCGRAQYEVLVVFTLPGNNTIAFSQPCSLDDPSTRRAGKETEKGNLLYTSNRAMPAMRNARLASGLRPINIHQDP